jgi:hypothetical protein
MVNFRRFWPDIGTKYLSPRKTENEMGREDERPPLRIPNQRSRTEGCTYTSWIMDVRMGVQILPPATSFNFYSVSTTRLSKSITIVQDESLPRIPVTQWRITCYPTVLWRKLAREMLCCGRQAINRLDHVPFRRVAAQRYCQRWMILPAFAEPANAPANDCYWCQGLPAAAELSTLPVTPKTGRYMHADQKPCVLRNNGADCLCRDCD